MILLQHWKGEVHFRHFSQQDPSVFPGSVGEDAHNFLWVRMAELDRFVDSSLHVLES